MATLECAHRKWGVGSGWVHFIRSPSNSAASHSTCACTVPLEPRGLRIQCRTGMTAHTYVLIGVAERNQADDDEVCE